MRPQEKRKAQPSAEAASAAACAIGAFIGLRGRNRIYKIQDLFSVSLAVRRTNVVVVLRPVPRSLPAATRRCRIRRRTLDR
jgi:hypothetical protein